MCTDRVRNLFMYPHWVFWSSLSLLCVHVWACVHLNRLCPFFLSFSWIQSLWVRGNRKVSHPTLHPCKTLQKDLELFPAWWGDLATQFSKICIHRCPDRVWTSKSFCPTSCFRCRKRWWPEPFHTFWESLYLSDYNFCGFHSIYYKIPLWQLNGYITVFLQLYYEVVWSQLWSYPIVWERNKHINIQGFSMPLKRYV